jgi:hypothetical protein
VRVERRKRFVEENHSRTAGERASNGDPLTLTPGERRRRGVGEVRDAESFEILVGPLLARVGHVLPDSEVREERVFLEDEADAPFVGLAKERPVCVQPNIVTEGDPPTRRPDEARDGSEHRGLTRARWPDQGNGAVDLER